MADESPAFPAFLRDFDQDALASDSSTLVALEHGGVMRWTNAAWKRFALANDGADVIARFALGTSYFDGIAGTLRGYFESAFENALSTNEPFELEYECSSPEMFRLLRLRALPIHGRGILVEHSPVVEHEHERAPVEPLDATYRRSNGLIVQCSNCRRAQRADESSWDWVPRWAARSPRMTTHALCTLCSGFYWGVRLRKP